MRYPKILSDGGKIGFIAPSFGCNIEPYKTCFDSAIKTFKSLGYETVLGPNCYAGDGIGKSTTPEKCGTEINEYFTSDKCDVIISCGGGETMCEDLPFVDFDAIREADPKWFMGYSDNTNLTFTLPTLCDTAAVYGPCASNFGMEPWHESIRDAFGVLCGKVKKVSNYDKWEREDLGDEFPLAPYNVTEDFCLQLINGTPAFSGRLLGGCMDCLVTLCGTEFDKVKEFNKKYEKDGVIWFLESCDLTPFGMRRALWQMRKAGWFDTAKGFLIGRPLHFDEEALGMNRVNAVTGVLADMNVPIVMDLDIGHLPPMMPIISGAAADITVEENSITIDYRFE